MSRKYCVGTCGNCRGRILAGEPERVGMVTLWINLATCEKCGATPAPLPMIDRREPAREVPGEE